MRISLTDPKECEITNYGTNFWWEKRWRVDDPSWCMTYHVSRRIYLGSGHAVGSAGTSASASRKQQPATINIAAWMHVNERRAGHKATYVCTYGRVYARMFAPRWCVLFRRLWLDTKTTRIHLACRSDLSFLLARRFFGTLVNAPSSFLNRDFSYVLCQDQLNMIPEFYTFVRELMDLLTITIIYSENHYWVMWETYFILN